MRNALALLAGLLLLPCLASAEEYTEQKTHVTIQVPEKWKTTETRKDFHMNAPDDAAVIYIVGMGHYKDAADALQKLDRDDFMGGLIKLIKVDGEGAGENRTVNGLKATVFTGTANVANVKVPFRACIVPCDRFCYVAFAWGEKEGFKSQAQAIDKAFASLERPDFKK